MVDLYAATWRDQGCEGSLGPAAPPSAAREPGDRIIKLFASDPRDKVNRIYTTTAPAHLQARRQTHASRSCAAPSRANRQAARSRTQPGKTVPASAESNPERSR